jgi:hypothetical protein
LRILITALTGWTVLDKDAITRRMTERLLISLGADPHDRHTDVYAAEVRPLEYGCLLAATDHNITAGVSLVLSAPFLTELHDPAWLTRLTHRCNAQSMDLASVWIRSDPATMHDYLDRRAAPRDSWKLTNWDEYTTALGPEVSPLTTHIIDNRHGAAVSLAEQTRTTLAKITA